MKEEKLYGIWRKLSDDKMIVFLDDDAESYIIEELKTNMVGTSYGE